MRVAKRWAVPTLLLILAAMPFSACRTDAPRQAGDQPHGGIDSVFLIIEYAGDQADTLSMSVSANDTVTVLDILTILAARDSIALETKEYIMGTLIEQIGDRRNGEGGYWIYTVNSKAIPAAASAHLANPGDTIRFIYYE